MIFTFNIALTLTGYIVSLPLSIERNNPTILKMIKQIFRKAAYCIRCGVCEANCKYSYLCMQDNIFQISDQCIKCGGCHKIDTGCLLYKSLVLPKGNGKMNNKSLDCYADHAPKIEWIESFFNLKDDFAEKNTLGSVMYSMFKRFLRDAELLVDGKFSIIAQILNDIGIDKSQFWGIILVNLSYSNEIGWFIHNIEYDCEILKSTIIERLRNEGVKEHGVNSIVGAYKRILSLPFGEKTNLGIVIEEKNKYIGIIRRRWQNPDPLVILYSLYKFAEACGDYYQFTLSRLLNHEIDSNGVSPTEIFGLQRDLMEISLNGLSVNYPDYISVSFNHDLDNITLRSNKSSQDVLSLF